MCPGMHMVHLSAGLDFSNVHLAVGGDDVWGVATCSNCGGKFKLVFRLEELSPRGNDSRGGA